MGTLVTGGERGTGPRAAGQPLGALSATPSAPLAASQASDRSGTAATTPVTSSGKRGPRAGTRPRKPAILSFTAQWSSALEEDVEELQAMQREQPRIEAQLQGFFAPGAAGPIRRGSGRLIWPVNGPITSPFCERRSWEACHPGIDIGAAGGTGIRAADSGTVRIASSYGGYGNLTCIQHSGSLSTCYGHQSGFAVSVGQSVKQGQVIGWVGCTGLCFGAHLHFEVRINGSVTDPTAYL